MNAKRLKTIVKLFEDCRYRHDLYALFSDFCECAAIAMSNSVDLAQRDAREARYLQIVGRYERDVIEAFAARTFDDLIQAIGDICDLFEPRECWNFLKAAGYVSV